MKMLKTLSDFQALKKNLKVNLSDDKLLQTAFIHRSYLNEHKELKGTSNERLEFLGDAVIALVISKFLYEHKQSSAEGELTKLRSALVRTETLAKIARNLHLAKYLYLSKGEEDSGGRDNSSILANTFEALVGAIYLDAGFEGVQKFLIATVVKNWQMLLKTAVTDYKSKLQEILQRKYHQSPSYRLLVAWGADHAKKFQIGAYLGDQILASGVGKSKQEAAQNAARNALARLKA